MKANVDQNLCSGCGLCEQVCPEVFEMGDDNIAKVKVGDRSTRVRGGVSRCC